MGRSCEACGAPLLSKYDRCRRCKQYAMEDGCSKCHGEGVYCWTCGEAEPNCECEGEGQNLGDCDQCNEE